MGGTEVVDKDEALAGQSSDDKQGSSSTPTYSEESERKAVSDALAKAGDKNKTTLSEAVSKERDSNLNAFKEQQDELTGLRRQLKEISDGAGDDATIARLIKEKQGEIDAAKTERENLKKEKEEHDKEWQEKKAKIDVADQAEFAVNITKLVGDYIDSDASKLTAACKTANITTIEAAKGIADALWSKKSSGSGSLMDGEPESGGLSGGSNTWESIRDAYIENPNDPKIKATYLEARRKRGY